MRRSERRNGGKRGSGRIVLLLVCLALVAASVTAAVLLKKETKLPQVLYRDMPGGSISERNVSEIAAITVTLRGGETWRAERDPDGTLRMADGENWTVDSSLGDPIQDAMANIVYEDILTEDPAVWRGNTTDFGLDDPLLSATVVYTDGNSVTLRIGDACGLDDETFHYMTVDGDDRLYAVSTGTVNDLRVERELLHTAAQPEITCALLDRITVTDGNGAVTAEWRLTGRITDPDADSAWQVTAPFVYPADEETVQNMKENAGKLRMGMFVSEATEDALKEYGFMPAAWRVELHMAAGRVGTVGTEGVYDTEERPESTVTLVIGNERNDMTDYVLFDGDIYTMNHFSAAVFTETDPFLTAARYIAFTPLDSLESLETESASGKDVYTLRHESSANGGNEAESGDLDEADRTTVVCEKNGKEIPYETFEAAYQRLMTVTVSGRLPEGKVKEETEKRYVFRSMYGGTHTVEFSAFDAMHDAVTVDGCTLFYLIRDGMTELP